MCGIRSSYIDEQEWLDATKWNNIHIKKNDTGTSLVTRVMFGDYTLFRKWERKESGQTIFQKFNYRGGVPC
jgi:hypothetical protein